MQKSDYGTIFVRASDGRTCGKKRFPAPIGWKYVYADRRLTDAEDAKRDCEEKLFELAQRYSPHVNGPRVTLRAWFVTYLDRKASLGRIAASTRATYEIDIRHHMAALLDMPVAQISSADIQQQLAGLNTAKQKRVGDLLSGAFKLAMRDLLPEGHVNPMTRVDRVVHRKKRTHLLSHTEAQAFLRALEGNEYRLLYLLAIMTGLRLGELFGLQWRDFDLVGRQLSIRRQVGKDGVVSDVLKTDGSAKPVPIGRTMYAELLAVKEADGEFIFANGAGKPLQSANFYRRNFLPLLAAAKLERFEFRCLRKSHGSFLHFLTGNIKLVKESMRHSALSTTDRFYVELFSDEQRDGAEQLDAFINGMSRDLSTGKSASDTI